MKNLLLIVMLACGVIAAEAQKKDKKDDEKIDAAQVPDSVKTAQEKAFPGIAVTKWELHTGKNPKKGNHYTAKFKDAYSVSNHTRYDKSGRMLSRSSYYDATHQPDVVVTAAKRYTGYTVAESEQIVSFKKETGTWYEVKLKGASGKKTVHLDEKGNEIPKDKKPSGDDADK